MQYLVILEIYILQYILQIYIKTQINKEELSEKQRYMLIRQDAFTVRVC